MIGLILAYVAITIGLALWRPDENAVARDVRDGFLTALMIGLIAIGAEQLLVRAGYSEYARFDSLMLVAAAFYPGAVALLPRRWMMTAFWRQAEKRHFLGSHTDVGKRVVIGGLFALVGPIAFGRLVMEARAVRSCRDAYAAAVATADSSRVGSVVTDASRQFAKFALRSYQQDCATVLGSET